MLTNNDLPKITEENLEYFKENLIGHLVFIRKNFRRKKGNLFFVKEMGHYFVHGQCYLIGWCPKENKEIFVSSLNFYQLNSLVKDKYVQLKVGGTVIEII